MNRKYMIILGLFMAPLILSGCLLMPAATGPDTVHTAAAQTIVAEMTQSAGQSAVAQLTQMAVQAGGYASATPPAPTATAMPTAVPPTATQQVWIPTATQQVWIPPATQQVWIPTAPPVWYPPTQAPPPVSGPCDWVAFIKDVSVPDGTVLAPGQSFSKTWRLSNAGGCTWTSGYNLVYAGGDRMHLYNAYAIPTPVRPGETVDVTATFVAPATPGRYRSYWMLSNARGYTFGIGSQAQKAFWVDIRVQETGPVPGDYPFDFTANMCTAVWHNGERNLPCPGDKDSADGSVIRLNTPVVETGKTENEPGLWTRPLQTRGGIIAGTFPAYRVQPGDRFMADIGCLHGSKGCDVTFYLDAQLPHQPAINLGSWREAYEGQMKRVDLDISAYAGQNVQFILRVQNNGKSSAANAFWLVPQIRHGSWTFPSPTPNPIPTVNPNPINIPAVHAAISTLAADLAVSPDQISVVEVESVRWPDSCLGFNIPGGMCAQMIIPGYQVILRVGGQFYEVHTDESGSLVLWVEA